MTSLAFSAEHHYGRGARWKNLKKSHNFIYKNLDFIIVESDPSDEVPESWTWLEGRLYCAIQFKTDYYSLNSAIKQREVEEIAKENNVISKAWLGLFEESEGSWKWPDGSPTNDYFNWKSPPTVDNKLLRGIIKFDWGRTKFGKWTSSFESRSLEALLCSKRTLQGTCRRHRTFFFLPTPSLPQTLVTLTRPWIW